MKEQELDRLLEQERVRQEDPAAEQSFQKKVRRAMNRTLYRRIFASLLAVALLGAAVYFGISAAMNALFYDPGDEAPFLVEDDRKNTEFRMLLEDTLSMYFPGMWCMVQSGDNWNSFTPTGFSGYDVDVLMKGPFDPLVLGGPPTHTFHIGMSKLDTGTALFSMNGNEFVPPETPDKLMEFYSPKEIRKELADLPASARLDVSLSLETYLTADQVAQLMKDYPDASFEWVALKGQEAGYYVGVAGGMNLYTTGWDAFSGPQAQERYAGYYLPPQEEVTGKALEQSLIARLRLLSDHPDFLRMMESRFQHIISPELVEERLARAEQEWSCYGILLTVGRDDLTRMLDQLPVTQAVVNDVRVSRFQKN